MTIRDAFTQFAASTGGPVASGPRIAVLDRIINEHNACQEAYEELRNYWHGHHKVRLTDRLKQFLRSNLFTIDVQRGLTSGTSPFSDNMCGIVINAIRDRMRIQAFTVPAEEPGPPEAEGGPETAGTAAKAMQDWAEINRMEALTDEVHELAFALGDAFVIVEYDPVRQVPVFYCNEPELIRIQYDPARPGTPSLVTKRWTAEPNERFPDGSVRLNLYFPDRIEKWAAGTSTLGAQQGWEHWMDEGDGQWPTPWLDRDGKPLGITIAHFRNDRRGNLYGRSELVDVLPLQDALNKGLVDFIKILDSQGWEQRWASGIDRSPNADLSSQPGAVWYASSSDARFGQFNAADPAKMIAALEHLISQIAHISSTPGYMFYSQGGGAAPSGEALKVADSPLVRKASNRQTFLGDSWEDVAEFAVRVWNAQPGNALIALPPTGFQIEWEPAETAPDELEHINAINAKSGLSNRQRLREYGGYSEEEITRILSEGEDEQEKLAEIQGRAFDAGLPV